MINFHRGLRRSEYECDAASITTHGQTMRALGRASINYPLSESTPLQRGLQRLKFVVATLQATVTEGRDSKQEVLFNDANASLDVGAMNGEEIRTLADNNVGVVIKPFG